MDEERNQTQRKSKQNIIHKKSVWSAWNRFNYFRLGRMILNIIECIKSRDNFMDKKEQNKKWWFKMNHDQNKHQNISKLLLNVYIKWYDKIYLQTDNVW